MNDIILGGPPTPLYEDDNLITSLSEYDNQIHDLINLFNSEYKLSNNKLKHIYESFIKETGFGLEFLENNANIIKDTQLALTNANTLYVSLLIGITLIILIWVFCLIGLYNWIIALVLTLVIIFFIFILSFAYYSKCNHIIDEEVSKLKDQQQLFLEVFKNSIPHWPKGLYNVLLKIVDETNNDITQKININENKLKKGCGCGK